MSVIDFILNLKDRMSGSLDRVSEKSAKTKKNLDDLNKAQEGVDGGAKKAAKSVGDLEEQLRKLKARRKLLPENATKELKDVNREIESLERNIRRTHTIGRTAGRRSGAGGMGLLANPMALVTGALVAGTFKAMESGAQQGHERVKMQNEFGGERGTNLFNSLRSQSSVGGLENGLELARAGVADKDVIPTLRRIGDVANGSESKMKGLVSTFAQMHKDGKLTAETLRELERNGLSPLNIMNQKTGESFKSMFDRLEAGEIRVHEVTNALRQATEQGGKFFGNLDRLDDTTLSRWSRLKDTIASVSANFGQNVLEALDLGSSDKTDEPLNMFDRARVKTMAGHYDPIDSILSLFGSPDIKPSENTEKGFTSVADIVRRQKRSQGMSYGRPMMGGDDIMSNKERKAEEKRRADLEAAKKNQDSINRVNGGGQRVYNITVGKLIETMNNTFQGGVKENASEINQIISQELIKLLASSTAR